MSRSRATTQPVKMFTRKSLCSADDPERRSSSGTQALRPISLTESAGACVRCTTAALAALLFLLAIGSPQAQAQSSFIRGDCNDDGIINIADGIFLLNRLFLSGPVPACEQACDVNGDGSLNLADAHHMFLYQLLGGPPPPAPFPECGFSPGTTGLTCLSSAECGGGVPALPSIDALPSLTNLAEIEVTGTAFGAVTVEVVAGPALVTSSVAAGAFSVFVPLSVNTFNQLHVTGISPAGVRSPIATRSVIQDSQPPAVFVDSPLGGTELTTGVVDVAGRVSDMLSGFMGLEVTVNGIPAIVESGIGTNGTFLASGVPLGAAGMATAISATATDAAGNSFTTAPIHVTRIDTAGVAFMSLVSGNGQQSQIHTALPEPLAVAVFDESGAPFSGKVVTFTVTRSDGRLAATRPDAPDGAMVYSVVSDSAGVARAYWALGGDAGCGNNRVRVTSQDIAGTVLFCASAVAAPPAQINIGSGNNQRAEVSTAAAAPLRVWVSDGCNGVGGVPVTFSVEQGGGNINGQQSVIRISSPTGHAEVPVTVGPAPVPNVVRATFPGNLGPPAAFVITGIARELGHPTALAGVIFDNGNQPIQGAECVLSFPGQPASLSTTTTMDGRFVFPNVPQSGPAHLHVDGLGATHVGGTAGMDVPPGSFPNLAFELLLIPNAANTLPMPVLLPPLDPANARVYDGSSDVTLEVAGVEGLRMLVRAGSMLRADGTAPTPNDPAILSLNQVHHDNVPMPMPDGAAPPFAWTLQPAGAHFDPPIEITYPNMSGLPPGAVAYFLSFNHGTNRFEIIGSGSVQPDGATIVSDAGVGIATAGWGCNCPPYAVSGNCCRCEECESCNCGQCVPSAASTCCNGVQYNPTTHGCCNGALYELATKACCGGTKVYDRMTQCCTADGAVTRKNPIADLDDCPSRVSNTAWTFQYDGCTWFPDTACGGSVVFANAGHTGPCDAHDECYQTCNSTRATCDATLIAAARARCNAPGNTANCMESCNSLIDIMEAGLDVFGQGAWESRQRQVCNCCP